MNLLVKTQCFGLVISLSFAAGCSTIDYEQQLKRHSAAKVCRIIGFPFGVPTSQQLSEYAYFRDSYTWQRLYKVEGDKTTLVVDTKRLEGNLSSSTYAVPPGDYRIEDLEYSKTVKLTVRTVKGYLYDKVYYKNSTLDRTFPAITLTARSGRVIYIDRTALSRPKNFLKVGRPTKHIRWYPLFKGYLERGYCDRILAEKTALIQKALSGEENE